MRTPSSPAAVRIAKLFNRRLITPWSDKEIKVFRGLVKQKCFDDDMHDLQLIERYYRSERMKGDKGIHRRDLATFLNNYHGELDRAKAWNENQTEKHKRKPSQIQKQRELSDEEFEALGDSFRKMVSELKTKLTYPERKEDELDKQQERVGEGIPKEKQGSPESVHERMAQKESEDKTISDQDYELLKKMDARATQEFRENFLKRNVVDVPTQNA